MILKYCLAFLFARVILAPQPIENRIVQGFPTLIQSHPYELVLLFHGRFICGAVLLTSSAGITAAHCIALADPSGKCFSVRAGSSFSDFGGTVMRIKKTHIHPNYKVYDYDIATFKLEEELPISSAIRPISVLRTNTDTLTGQKVEVSGWGVTIPGFYMSVSMILMETTITIINRQECKKYFLPGIITDRMICAKGELFSDSCYGDSGGPLVWNNALIGLVSFGKGCAEGYPGVYTDVTKYRDFIKQNT